VSFNQLLVDQPRPEIARSAVVLGEVHVGAGAILAQGLVVRSHGAAVSIGNYSAILENGVVIGTLAHPVRVGQRTVFGHRATIVGATIGDLCEIGNGAILMPGSRLGSGCILGEGTLVPPDTVIAAGSVLVGRPPHVIRSATDADRERLAVLRQHQTNLTDYPGTVVPGPMRAGERMGTLYAYRDKTPSIGAGTLLFDSAEITGDVAIGKDSLIGAGVKIIGDSHGPVRIGSRADPGEHGAAPAARQRTDHRRRRGDRPGRDDPRLPHRPRQRRRAGRDRVRRQRGRGRVGGPRRCLRQAARPFR
jgi:carbonic anhydrase/acetyltransferase-like protein (isoleucine patch superfamily)